MGSTEEQLKYSSTLQKHIELVTMRNYIDSLQPRLKFSVLADTKDTRVLLTAANYLDLGELTHAGVSVLLESCRAHTPPNGHQPLSLSAAVHLGRVPLLGVIHTLTPDLHQRRRVGARHHVGENRQFAAHAHAALVVHAHRREGDASADILEGQVESSLGQGADPAHLWG